jgi:hypothetical protein
MTTKYQNNTLLSIMSFDLLVDNKHDVSSESCKQFYYVYLPFSSKVRNYFSYVQVTGYCCKQLWRQDENSQGRSMPHSDADGKI